jgi:hypothetical protein
VGNNAKLSIDATNGLIANNQSWLRMIIHTNILLYNQRVTKSQRNIIRNTCKLHGIWTNTKKRER